MYIDLLHLIKIKVNSVKIESKFISVVMNQSHILKLLLQTRQFSVALVSVDSASVSINSE